MEDKIVIRELGEKSSLWISRRELLIVESIQEGLNNKEIGSKLGITEKTVETHRHNILKRLRCRNSSQLITKLFRNQLIT